jgi:hypothetical protein
MAGNAAGARTVAAVASVSMGENAASARNVEGAAYVSTGDDAASARLWREQHLSARSNT